MKHLLQCPSCERHVRASEDACPFCGTQIDDALRISSAPRAPVGRVGRAALLGFAPRAAAIGAALATSLGVAGCHESAVPAYGAPAPEDAGTADAGTMLDAAPETTDTGGPVPLYGGAPRD